ncbi:MAG: hypothetical protein JW981_04035 [Anaerolineae bacterium]|nr:hypothetical protein [Anaerolineae bacterium]
MKTKKLQIKVKTNVKAGGIVEDCTAQCVARGGDYTRCYDRCKAVVG